LPEQVAEIEVGSQDCFLLDVYFPKGSGIDLLKQLRKNKVPIVLMSNAASVPLSVQAMKFGADDFVEKAAGISVIVDSILTVLATQSLRTPMTSDIDINVLTAQEKVVFVELQNGCSSKEIALALGLSVRTIDGHRSNILRKLGVSTVVELISRCRLSKP
jgi:FixJ family two-component response regulator